MPRKDKKKNEHESSSKLTCLENSLKIACEGDYGVRIAVFRFKCVWGQETFCRRLTTGSVLKKASVEAINIKLGEEIICSKGKQVQSRQIYLL